MPGIKSLITIPDFSLSPRIDQVGVEERASRFTKRSIKKETKMNGLKLVLNMIDLTTLEGKDTDGKVKQLCYKAMHPHDALPDIPTVGEFVPGFEASNWYGVGIPKNTPAEIIDKLNSAINAGLAEPKYKARFTDLGAEIFTGSPADFGRFIVDYTEKWAPVIRAAGVKAE